MGIYRRILANATRRSWGNPRRGFGAIMLGYDRYTQTHQSLVFHALFFVAPRRLRIKRTLAQVTFRGFG